MPSFKPKVPSNKLQLMIQPFDIYLGTIYLLLSKLKVSLTCLSVIISRQNDAMALINVGCLFKYQALVV